ncbi:peptide chain release factor N(5)-glutamine methyltransferase [Listeria costaricensis]|uniref:peptide chain release factor N(5)-glutamine methyltransferase n=1 Tax=Listeria costaricensis TaxID=2026604 RepID=UPI000C086768
MLNKSIGTLLHEAKQILTERHLDLNAAEILMETRLGLSRSALWLGLDRAISAAEQAQFEKDFARYLDGEPVQYILETAPFYGYDFYVDKRVLIPRPETEELVLLAENHLKKIPAQNALDVCTGSGIIAITLKKLCPDLPVTATDISADALQVAEKNAQTLQADVRFQKMNLIDQFLETGDKFDLITANPPYIAESEKAEMSASVLAHEPSLALFAENEGLALYQELIHNLPKIVMEKYWIVVEIGYTQGNAVKELFQKSFPQANVIIHKDINQKNRMVSCTNMLV